MAVCVLRGVAVVGHDTVKPRDADLRLAYGLAYRGDRDLCLIVPSAAAQATMVRLAWINPLVRVFTYNKTNIHERLPPARTEILGAYDDVFVDGHLQLGERLAWVNGLIQWAGQAPGLQPPHRLS